MKNISGTSLIVSKRASWGAVVGFALVVIALIVVLLFWSAHETKQRLDIGYGITTNANSARLEIGDKVFYIPKNYIWSREDWKGGRVTGVNLHTLLPDFEPLTEVNRQEFDNRRGIGRKIRILLSEHAMPVNERPTGHVSMTRQEIYERITRNQTARDLIGAFGLRLQKFPNPKDIPSDDDIFVGTKPDGSFYWVQCSPGGKVPFPSCSTHIEYSTHTYIKYTYSKAQLSDWVKIENGVINLIKQFENNANQGEHK